MKKLTQAEFDAMIRARDERGYINIPDETDCSEIYFYSADNIIFGNWCKLGDGCTLGNWCKLGNRCTLGNDCTLGYGCTLGNGCKLGDGCKLGKDTDLEALASAAWHGECQYCAKTGMDARKCKLRKTLDGLQCLEPGSNSDCWYRAD